MNEFKRSSGFTLIEVLVTVLILAIGLLGLAGLQLNALRNNTTAYERSQATILAYDVIDRMRANRGVTASYAVAIDDAPGTQICKGSGANCTPAQLAAYDLAQWKCSLGAWNTHANCIALGITDGKLSNGDGSVVINGDSVTVTIQWEENRGAAADKITAISINTVI